MFDISKDTDYWFADGNLVIVAQDHHPDAPHIGFRVHKGVLFHHCDVFRELLDTPLPQSADSAIKQEDTIDGCPVMFVSDSFHDFKEFLRVMYDGLMFPGIEEQVEFGVVAALVRLGHKYDAVRILDVGLKRLKSVFSIYYVTWNNARGRGSPSLALKAEDHIEAANLFRTIERPELLAIALYACAELDEGVRASSVTRVDGFVEILTPDDIARSLDGRDRLVRQRTKFAFAMIELPPRLDCSTRAQCKQALLSAKPLIFRGDEVVDGIAGTGPLGPVFPDWPSDSKLCTRCRMYFRARDLQFRKDLWRDLPSLMGVIEWKPEAPINPRPRRTVPPH
ncbi:hypothetical protein C8Q78DRAFT_647974 [Trametes maxima]|nr:hypothetical protein C8Q78DRAFT_647974 [Trametes maxima]